VVLSLHWQPEGALRLTVRDTGCGFEPHLLEHLFGAYNQANRQDARGTGLGLAISRRIARALGGDLTGHSQPRVGSCFELRLPASVEGRPPVPPGTAESARPA
jgi:signal transduction histidine kinase